MPGRTIPGNSGQFRGNKFRTNSEDNSGDTILNYGPDETIEHAISSISPNSGDTILNYGPDETIEHAISSIWISAARRAARVMMLTTPCR
jgi:hypothetical protein